MPAGTYDVHIGNGTIDIGSGGLLPPLTLNSGTSFTIPIGTQPASAPIGLTIPDVPISASPVTGVASITVAGAGVTIDPTSGSATLDASVYGLISLSGDLGFGTMSTTCPIGSSSSPVSLHLTTADGSAWDPATGGLSLVDKMFVLPTIHCSQPLFDAFLSLVLGTVTNAGDNIVTIVGTAVRQPDPITNPTTTTSQPGSGSSGGGSTTTTTTTTTGNPPTAPAAKRCVVPKLVGKTLKQAKRALTKAGCKVGKAKSKKSKKKKGRVLAQGKKAGTRLPAGAKVPLTVSRGPKPTRKHRSR
jgi:hypothetical protein